ncbi:type II toxin-antitoxin system YafO family toxin [Pseudomonas sp. LFM046]|uniref:type II toxin-antitoxin system YafO family toxin n=1 Tax=Pseudomonas sp. LFM046 TaxID=1608357 RepID=UPI0009E5FF95|nr:type II toxin-antitoxin system YafO family toxin [Pseudomonas sp. LFM046]
MAKSVRIDQSPQFHDYLQQAPAEIAGVLAGLVSAFTEYAAGGYRSHHDFGRDAPLHRPPSVYQAGLRHIHCITLDVQERPALMKRWLRSTSFHRKTDRMLVYARDDQGNSYLLAYFHGNAHALIENRQLMLGLAEEAERWLKRTGAFPDC